MNFNIIIPTYNREKDLTHCMDSVFYQTIFPSEILIIDDGNLSENFLNGLRKRVERKSINFIYYKKDHTKERRGISESKNIAIKKTLADIFFILDDDLVMDKDFFEKIMTVWKKNKDNNLIGVGGIIKNRRKKTKIEKIYNKIFGLTSRYGWDINDVGFQVWDEQVNKAEKGYYVHGGVCSYKRSLVEKLKGFTTFSGGRTTNEDIDFCLRAKNKGYHFIIEPNAKVIHKQSKISRENDFLMGFKDSYNRKIIFKSNCEKSIKNYLWFFWSNIGWVLKQFIIGKFLKGFGMLKGLFTSTKK